MRNPFENPSSEEDDAQVEAVSKFIIGEIFKRQDEALNGWEKIGELYSLMRSALVEKEAWELHGGFQAAACGKPIEECRQIASYKLRADCPACEHTGTIVEGAQGAQHLVTCEQCDGCGYIELPALEWMYNGKVQFALLPGDHPDYDPSK